MALEGCHRLARRKVPQADRFVAGTRREPFAVGGKGYGIDRASMAVKFRKLPAAGSFPDAHGLVGDSGKNSRSQAPAWERGLQATANTSPLCEDPYPGSP